MGFFDKLFGNGNEAELKKINKIVDKIDALEETYKALSDAELAGKTEIFKKRLADGETLDDILPEAFAAVREAAWRTLGMRHYRVQLIGGVVLHQGRIAEMKTGEGKTLVATLPAYLNALSGKGVFIVTVNDYLAHRDAEWMGKVHRFLGLTVGTIEHDMDNEERRAAYNADITYGANHEFGFDYLRDNMVVYKEAMVQRSLHYAIVDEVDSILIDEARTPLIISGQGDKSTEMYALANNFARRLRPEEDFVIEEKEKAINLTDVGVEKAEKAFGVTNLGDIENTTLMHHLHQALRANFIMKRDRDYVVKDGQVVIVDEFTGRLMTGRRYSDGLHQAIEAKENVKVERESKTLATITYQNFFRMFDKLAGMTGTAKTEEAEFQSIYNLDVITIPTNKPMIRNDMNDVVYRNARGKFNAVIEDIVQCHEKGQPVLVGTVSVEKSEYLSELLRRRGVPHVVLNAKFHEKEAEIVAQAGQYGAVTIATNMAGRGTDILLGGNPEFMARRDMKKEGFTEEQIENAVSHQVTSDPEILALRARFDELYAEHKKTTDAEKQRVIAVGGLKIIGTERHESRRIDNQLRGRAGRQGDPGASRFYISLEDDLMRIFGSERIMTLVDRIGLAEDQPLENGMLSNQIESAQKRVEGKNFNIRKSVLQYDDVMNVQREIIYKQRRTVLMGEDLRPALDKMMHQSAENLTAPFLGEEGDRDVDALITALRLFGVETEKLDKRELAESDNAALVRYVYEAIRRQYEAKDADAAAHGVDMREVERILMLRAVDEKWMNHIDDMDQMRQGIGLRSYGQHDPVVEYKMVGFEMFDEMIGAISRQTISSLLRVGFTVRMERKQVARVTAESAGGEEPAKKKPVKNAKAKVGRNDPCPCGSGKKYKYCCGAGDNNN
ncbi:MAG: preprotein translocase subunit SecA [Eubacteriales bacterium]|nr:preprotein translocase subunit SecA [Eubacteriales bacterium]